MPLQRIAELLASDDFPAIVLLHRPSPSASLCGYFAEQVVPLLFIGYTAVPNIVPLPYQRIGLYRRLLSIPLKVTGTGWCYLAPPGGTRPVSLVI